jgi:hypothetical protein
MGNQVSFDRITEALRARGFQCYTEQTGGGVAAIYGLPFNEEGLAPWLCGPGWFSGSGWVDPVGDTSDLTIGHDDFGEGPYVRVPEDADEAAIVELVVKFVAGPPQAVEQSPQAAGPA